MGPDDTDSGRGIEMTAREMEDFLYEHGHGILSLANESDAYAVPVSFGYDGETVFLYLIQFDGGSKKLAFTEDAGTVCLTAYEVRSRSEWDCLLVYGHLDDNPDAGAEYMDEIMDNNAWFPSLHPPDWPITDVVRTTLSIDSMTGRKGRADAGRQT